VELNTCLFGRHHFPLILEQRDPPLPFGFCRSIGRDYGEKMGMSMRDSHPTYVVRRLESASAGSETATGERELKIELDA
jgi:hypothetical protein